MKAMRVAEVEVVRVAGVEGAEPSRSRHQVRGSSWRAVATTALNAAHSFRFIAD
jgi:hypothetical protein